MTYATYKATLIGMVGPSQHRHKLRENPKKTNRVVRTLTNIVAGRGSEWAMRDEAGLRKAAQQTFGVFPAIFAPVLMAILEMLLPVLLQWLREQLQSHRFGGGPNVDETMQALSRQATMVGD